MPFSLRVGSPSDESRKHFKHRGLKVDLIPVPREISSDCGVAIELPWGLRKRP